MKIVDVLNRFEGVTQTGMDSWVAMCPTHGDTQQTLLIKLKPDGRVLLHCHAGCTVEEICAAVGLKLSDLMPERPKIEKPASRYVKLVRLVQRGKRSSRA